MFLHVISLLRKAQKAEGGKGDNQKDRPDTLRGI